MHVFKNDVGKAVEILGDIVMNSKIEPGEIELTKEEVGEEHEQNCH